MSAATIFHILAYTAMPDWLFYVLITLPLAGIVGMIFEAILDWWRAR